MDEGVDVVNSCAVSGAPGWRGLAGRHWRGDLGLGRSLWMPLAAFGVFGALFLAVLFVVRSALAPLTAFMVTAASWVLLLLMVWWLCAGLFRAGMRGHGRGVCRAVTKPATGAPALC
jgi:hypothetical protein